jgi:hypothetical protein
MTLTKCCVINLIEPQWTLVAVLIRVHNRHKCIQQDTSVLMHVISICEVPNSNVGHFTCASEVFCVVYQFLKLTKMSQNRMIIFVVDFWFS